MGRLQGIVYRWVIIISIIDTRVQGVQRVSEGSIEFAPRPRMRIAWKPCGLPCHALCRTQTRTPRELPAGLMIRSGGVLLLGRLVLATRRFAQASTAQAWWRAFRNILLLGLPHSPQLTAGRSATQGFSSFFFLCPSLSGCQRHAIRRVPECLHNGLAMNVNWRWNVMPVPHLPSDHWGHREGGVCRGHASITLVTFDKNSNKKEERQRQAPDPSPECGRAAALWSCQTDSLDRAEHRREGVPPISRPRRGDGALERHRARLVSADRGVGGFLGSDEAVIGRLAFGGCGLSMAVGAPELSRTQHPATTCTRLWWK